MKTVIILRGVPGNGKSTVAEYIKGLTDDFAVICCADDYFTGENGEYNFDFNQLHRAHKHCQDKFDNAIAANCDLIIVANTSTRQRDVNAYRNNAIAFGYRVFVLTVENWHEGKDVHNVPEEAKSKMREQLLNSIKL